MNQENTAAGVHEVVPILFIPKQCTKLEMNCDMSENVFIDLSITSPDTEGNDICIYSGFCNVKLIESCNIKLYPTETVEVEQESSSNSSLSCEDINQMPVIFSEANNAPTQSYNQSQVWIDPARSPYVYNHYDTTPQQTYSILESAGCITVQQHNTYITQNVYSYDHQSQRKDLERINLEKIQEARNQLDSPEIFYEDDDSESEVFLSQLSKKNTNKDGDQSNIASVQGKNDALKQLMSTDIQSTSKQRKTILFLGEDSSSGQTIQNILYTDPLVKCSAVDVDHEVIIEETASPAPKKKKYQCDKCKQIFEQISEFRQHMVGNHTMYKVLKDNDLACSECGKKFSNDRKYQMHYFGHGDPDLECPKCHKVYASKNTLKVHMKIHNRKFPCPYCFRSYATSESYKSHMKMHSKFVCQYDGCFFTANSVSRRDDHHEDHTEDYHVDGHKNKNTDYNVDHFDGNDIHDNDEHSNYDHGTEENGDGDNGNDEHDDDLINDDHGNDEHDDDDRSNDVRSNKINSKEDHGTDNHDKDDHGNGHLGKGNHSDEDNNHMDVQHDVTKESSDSNIAKSYMDDLNEDFEEDLITLNTDCELKSEMAGDMKGNDSEVEVTDISTVEGNDQDERVKRADSVIAKVMSNKIFLANKKVARTHASYNKTCQVCSKSFDRVGDLKRHLIEHIIKCTLAKAVSNNEGTLHIYCEICQSESFNTIDRYKAHLREHAKLTIYKCTFCDKSFSDSSNFSKHKKIHGISYFQCDLCHRRFNSKMMIARHIDLHTKNKPLKCKHCERYFHFESMLNKHVKSVHCKPAASRFPCRFCRADFGNLKGKWDHEWSVHNIRKTIVDCLVCGAKFRKYSELKKHCLDDHEMDIPTRKKLLKKDRSAKFICT